MVLGIQILGHDLDEPGSLLGWNFPAWKYLALSL